MKKTIKKVTCSLLAAVSVFGCAASMSACTTAHPKVEITVTFNGESYELDYTLYRKVAPATVAHFLWLAENGYYDGLCVHEYSANNRMYTGAYSVSAEHATELVYKKYFDTVKGYDNVAEFPHSVWLDEAQKTPAYTLKGEFDDNGFIVTNGELQETFGSLTMYYNSIDPDNIADKKVSVLRGDGNTNDMKVYQLNHATSEFFISLSTTAKNNSSYCTFATLGDDGKEELQELQEAIEAYISKNFPEDESDFLGNSTVEIFEDDVLFEDSAYSKTYKVPKSPIVITKVKVTKY